MEVAAAAIAFIQISVQTLTESYRLWELIRDVPEEIQDLVTDLRDLKRRFGTLEKQIKNSSLPATVWDSAEVLDSLTHAENAQKALDDIVTILKADLDRPKRKWKATVKYLVKKDTLDRLEKRLLRATKLLDMCLQGYHIALLHNSNSLLLRQPDLIAEAVIAKLVQGGLGTSLQQQIMVGSVVSARQQPTRIEGAVDIDEFESLALQRRPKRPPHADENKKNPTIIDTSGVKSRAFRTSHEPSLYGRYMMTYRADTGAWKAYIQLPSWLSTTVFEVESAPIISGWKFCTRIYSVLSPESELLRRMDANDLAGVKELFRTGRASPFDRLPNGASLLMYPSDLQIYELLLSLGLYIYLDDPKGSPLDSFLHSKTRLQDMSEDSKKALKLNQSYLALDPDIIRLERLFELRMDYYDSIRIFTDRYMLNYDERIASDRFEAFRLGCFAENSSYNVRRMLSRTEAFSKADVRMSTGEKLSVMHSVAVGLGRRLPAHVVPQPRMDHFTFEIWSEDWHDMVVEAASVVEPEHLHAIEEMIPWDLDPIPAWTGTPLISAIGGTLCFLSPDYQYSKWDEALQGTVQHWARNLASAGVDLMAYGKRERAILREDVHGVRGAFDVDSIIRSRPKKRRSLRRQAQLWRRCDRVREYGNIDSARDNDDQRWRPVRLIELKIGPSPEDWSLEWTVEYEHFANQFWKLFEEEESIDVPGSWVDE